MTAAAAVQQAAPLVSVVVPSWNVREHLAGCLRAVEAAARELGPERTGRLELIVVDDASHDGSAELVERDFPAARLVRHTRNLGFTAATNRGLRDARGEFVLLLNADCELQSGALTRLLDFLRNNAGYAAAAPRLLGKAGETQPACMNLPRLSTPLWHGTPLERWKPDADELRRYFARDFDHERDADVEQPPAACLLIRRRVLEELGGLDPRMTLFFSDVDLSKRMAAAGHRTRFVAGAVAVHAEGESTAQHPDRLVTWHSDRLAYYRIHHGALAGAWVKGCVLVTAVDHLARRRVAPSKPFFRQVAGFLAS